LAEEESSRAPILAIFICRFRFSRIQHPPDPLVIAGGKPDENLLAYRVDGLARQFQRGLHYTLSLRR